MFILSPTCKDEIQQNTINNLKPEDLAGIDDFQQKWLSTARENSLFL